MKKLNFYKNEKGYLVVQGKEVYHTDKIYKALGTIKPNEQLLNAGYKLEIVTLDEFSKMYSPIITQMIIAGDVLHQTYKSYNENFPVIPGDHKQVRNAVNNAKNKTAIFHDQVSEILKDEYVNEDAFFESRGDYQELIINISEAMENGTLAEINEMFKNLKK